MKTNHPSQTARKVAFNIIALGSKKKMQKILPKDIVGATKKLLISSGAASKTTVQIASRMAWVYEAFDWMMPGQFHGFGYRKAFCEEQVCNAITSGATQVLVLGAGYDTLSWRLAPKYPDVIFFEIDHPATARVKAQGIEHMKTQPNHHLIAEDLGEHQLQKVIQSQPAWNVQSQTAIVAEGLLMYLTQSSVEDLFKQCKNITGNKSRIVFSFIHCAKNGTPDAGPMTGLVLWLLKASGEPWLWSSSHNNLDSLLTRCGWMKVTHFSNHIKVPGVEHLAVASK